MHNKLKSILLDVLKVQSESGNVTAMNSFIVNFAKEQGVEVVYEDGNLYITKGVADSYPCMVSHTDTVHKIIPNEFYTIVTNEHGAMGMDIGKMQPTGCGGDDKVGIAMCLMFLTQLDNVKLAFFKDEEVGCVGSYNADMDFFDDVRFVLQCDRRGNSDFVNNIYGTELQSKSFKKAVKPLLKKYGYTTTTGMLTDVYALKQNGLNVSVANMSCGYYNPHQDDEIVMFEDVFNCYDLCNAIMTTMTDTYKHTSKAKVYDYKYTGYGSSYNRYGGYDNWADDDWDLGYIRKDKPRTHQECDCCNKLEEVDDLIYSHSYNMHLCIDCYHEYEGYPPAIDITPISDDKVI